MIIRKCQKNYKITKKEKVIYSIENFFRLCKVCAHDDSSKDMTVSIYCTFVFRKMIEISRIGVAKYSFV